MNLLFTFANFYLFLCFPSVRILSQSICVSIDLQSDTNILCSLSPLLSGRATLPMVRLSRLVSSNQRLWNDVVQWWILDFVKWRGYRDRRRLVAKLAGSDRGGCEFRRRFHAVARVPRQILVAEGGEGGRRRRKADIIVQTTATIAEGHGHASDASLPPRREGWPWDRDSRGISWWVDWIPQFSLCLLISLWWILLADEIEQKWIKQHLLISLSNVESCLISGSCFSLKLSVDKTVCNNHETVLCVDDFDERNIQWTPFHFNGK